MVRIFSIRASNSPDYLFISIVAMLMIFGLVMLTSASSDLAKTRYGDSFYYLKHQLLYGLSFGFFGFLFGLFFYYKRWEKIAGILLILNIFLLLLVFTPLGLNTKGSTRWLNIAGFSFQPGEILKLVFLIYIAVWCNKKQTRGKSLTQGFLPFLFLLAGIGVLLMLQPSTTIAVLIFIAAIITYFSAGARLRFLIGMVIILMLAVAAVILITPYRLQRVLSYFNPEIDKLGTSYQINQSLIAIGSGGISGVGFGQSTTKLKYLPEPLADSIFAIIGEELGFIGSMVIVVLFLMLIWRGFLIAKNSPDNFGRLLATAFTSLIGLQAFINIASVSGLIPLTGVPLPFISYGGTALAVFLTMSGIIVNISRHRR